MLPVGGNVVGGNVGGAIVDGGIVDGGNVLGQFLNAISSIAMSPRKLVPR